MKYCTKCGKELFDEAVICPGCGCAQDNAPATSEKDSKSFGWALLGFFVPVAGLILYIIWKDSMPLRAKSCGKGALASVIIGVVAYIFIIVLFAVIGTMGVFYSDPSTLYEYGETFISL